MSAVVSLTQRRLAIELADAAPFLAQAQDEGWSWSVDHHGKLGWSVFVRAPGCRSAMGEHSSLALAAEQAVTEAAHLNLERQLAGSVEGARA